jgi:hypothetical protein
LGLGLGPFGAVNGGRISADVADQAVTPVSADHRFMQLLGQLPFRERGKSPRKSGFRRDLSRTLPTTEPAQDGAGGQGIQQGSRGRKVINGLGNKSVRHPGAFFPGASLALPAVRFQEPAQGDQGHDLDKMPVLDRQITELFFQNRKQLTLYLIPDIKQYSHITSTVRALDLLKTICEKSKYSRVLQEPPVIKIA